MLFAKSSGVTRWLICLFTFFCVILQYNQGYGDSTKVADSSDEKSQVQKPEKFPEGVQIKQFAGLWGRPKKPNTLERQVNASIKNVWNTMQEVAMDLEMNQGRKIVQTNEQLGKIQIGTINKDEMVDGKDWYDEIILYAKRIDTSNTKLVVSRRIVKKMYASKEMWVAEYSNDEIEKYILDKIQYDLSQLNKPK